MVKFRDRLLDIVERFIIRDIVPMTDMMAEFDEVIADVEIATRNSLGYRYADPVGVAAPPAQDAKWDTPSVYTPLVDLRWQVEAVERRLDAIERWAQSARYPQLPTK